MIEVTQGNGPIALGLPETGPDMLAEIWETPNETAHASTHTDRSIHRHNAALEIDLKRVCSSIHRQGTGASRAPNEARPRSWRNTARLYPHRAIVRTPNYREEHGHDTSETARRTEVRPAPCQTGLSTEIQQVRVKHGAKTLHDCHLLGRVIQPPVKETLQGPNIFVGSSTSCVNSVERSKYACCKVEFSYSCVHEGHWEVRSADQLTEINHKFQMEMAQLIHLDETPPWSDRVHKTGQIRPGFTVFSVT